jgi:signal transduction histidine kinase
MTIRNRLMLWYTVALVLALGAITATIYYEIFVEHPNVNLQWRLRAEGETPEEELGEALMFAGIPAALLSLAGAWILMRRAFAPVARLTDAAERLHADNLRTRLPRSGNNDELDRLTDVFNVMTARLDDSFRRVREFTLHASHELKTPLTVMRGEMETALRDEPMSAQEGRRLAGLLEEVERLTQIVDGLNFLAKADAGMLRFEQAPVRLDELVYDACADANVLAAPQGIIATAEAPDAVTVIGDRRRLRQLLLILTDNAVKYNHAKGEVRMRLSIEEGQALLEVSNTGEGMTSEAQERAFDRFFRGDSSHNRGVDGCGLGLSIARQIVQAHRGEIRIESEPRSWTTVKVTLPVSRAHAVAAAATPEPELLHTASH